MIEEMVALLQAASVDGPRGRRTCPCAIVYVFSRKDCQTLASALCKKGIKAKVYHAGLSPSKRMEVQDSWQDGNRCQVVVATVAFGMGIDKSDVRFVFHSVMPTCLERYYQEVGRGGRDGGQCRAVLWYSARDLVRLKRLVKTQRE